MSNITKVILGVIAVVAVVFGFRATTDTKVQGVNRSNEYQALTIVPATTATGGMLCTAGGALGSIVITGAAAGVIEIYDATTTNGTLRTTVATSSLTKLATIPASTVAGTYVFDVVANTGLAWARTLAATPTTTLTYRCY